MNEKVKLPREVAEVIDKKKRDLSSEWKKIVLKIAISTHAYVTTDPESIIRKYSDDGGFDTLIRALVNDYEVEETPEERIKRIFNMPNKAAHYKAGVIDALDALNMKIEGVNA